MEGAPRIRTSGMAYEGKGDNLRDGLGDKGEKCAREVASKRYSKVRMINFPVSTCQGSFDM